MQFIKNKIEKIATVIVALILPAIVSAQSRSIIPQKPDSLPGPAGGAANIQEWIVEIIQIYLLPLAGIIAVLFIIIGGYQYIFSGASEDLAKKGKSTLTNSVIGLVIIILSYVIIRIVAGTLGAR